MSDATAAVERIDGPITHTHIGGQAVLEGVMMRGKLNWAIAVRTPDGSIYTEQHDLKSAAAKHDWMRKPIIRGVVALVETLSLAMKAFEVSASMAGETEEEQLSSKEIALSMGLGLALAIGLFIIAPALLTTWMVGGSAAEKPFEWNVVDGILRVAAFFIYIWAISRIPDIQRVFAYHGAEHKTIHAYEHGLPLETDIIQRYSTQHMRCGTSFLLMVMVVAIVVFSFVPVKAMALAWGFGKFGALVLAILSRIILLPLVAGIAYEITVKWAGNHSSNPVVKVMLWPGLQLQRMTTREPDDEMVEVAVASMLLVVEREEREAAIARGEDPDAPVEAEAEDEDDPLT